MKYEVSVEAEALLHQHETTNNNNERNKSNNNRRGSVSGQGSTPTLFSSDRSLQPGLADDFTCTNRTKLFVGLMSLAALGFVFMFSAGAFTSLRLANRSFNRAEPRAIRLGEMSDAAEDRAKGVLFVGTLNISAEQLMSNQTNVTEFSTSRNKSSSDRLAQMSIAETNSSITDITSRSESPQSTKLPNIGVKKHHHHHRHHGKF